MSAALQTEAIPEPIVEPALLVSPNLLLRKCACGGPAGMNDDCPECSGTRLSLQRKVSRPGDALEIEADRLAERVMGSLRHPARMDGSPSGVPAIPVPQRSGSDKGMIFRQVSASEGPAPAATGQAAAAAQHTPAAREAASTPHATPAGLIVEDDAREIAPGQMRKSQFLDELRSSVCAAADAELAAVGRSAQGCPYIENWIGHYRSKSSRHVERALYKYAPEAAGITSARDYIPTVSNRIRRSVSVWATTGQMIGVPEEVAGQTPAGGSLGAVGGLVSGVPSAAGAVVSGIGSVASSPSGIGKAFSSIGSLFFKAREGGAREADADEIRSQFGPGQSLDGEVKSRMESAFGHDFSKVRVHNDAGAAGLSATLNARAFTLGNHIAFGASEYHPGTLIGDGLIAHELAHVTQQAGSGPISNAGQEEPGDNLSLELDANESAARAVLAAWAPREASSPIGRVNAMPARRAGLGLQRCSSGSGGASGAPTVVVGHFRNSGSTADSGENNCAACPQVLGVRPRPDWHNGMELRGDVAGHRPDAMYDFKRTKERAMWKKVGGAWTQISHIAPGTDDDSTNDDESLSPTNDHIYVTDWPGLENQADPVGDASATEAVYKASFVEWVNVRVGVGAWSKGSNDFQWHSITWLEKVGGAWRRKAGANEIETGATTVGTGNP